MTAEEYVAQELAAGRLTHHHLVLLTREYQLDNGLEPDGRPGPATRAALDFLQRPDPKETLFKFACPLHPLPDGRKAVITSAYRTADRPNHDGVDLFYHYAEGDSPSKGGDGGAAVGKDGKPKWVVPYGQYAFAAAAGTVQVAGYSKTGYRCWIDHGNGWRTGYFHLLDLKVHQGEHVLPQTPLGLVGHNPSGFDARHLHFELSPVDRYAPVDPQPHILGLGQ